MPTSELKVVAIYPSALNANERVYLFVYYYLEKLKETILDVHEQNFYSIKIQLHWSIIISQTNSGR